LLESHPDVLGSRTFRAERDRLRNSAKMQIWVALLSYAIFKLRSAKEGVFSMFDVFRKAAFCLENKQAENNLNFCEVIKVSAVFLYGIETTTSRFTLVRCRFPMRDVVSSMRGSQIPGLIHIRGP